MQVIYPLEMSGALPRLGINCEVALGKPLGWYCWVQNCEVAFFFLFFFMIQFTAVDGDLFMHDKVNNSNDNISSS